MKEENKKIKSPDDRISDELWAERLRSGDVKKWDEDHKMGLEFVDGLRKGIQASIKRHEILKKINEIEERKFPCPPDVVGKKRDEMSEEQGVKLDGHSIELRDRCWEIYGLIEWAVKYLGNTDKTFENRGF